MAQIKPHEARAARKVEAMFGGCQKIQLQRGLPGASPSSLFPPLAQQKLPEAAAAAQLRRQYGQCCQTSAGETNCQTSVSRASRSSLANNRVASASASTFVTPLLDRSLTNYSNRPCGCKPSITPSLVLCEPAALFGERLPCLLPSPNLPCMLKKRQAVIVINSMLSSDCLGDDSMAYPGWNV